MIIHKQHSQSYGFSQLGIIGIIAAVIVLSVGGFVGYEHIRLQKLTHSLGELKTVQRSKELIPLEVRDLVEPKKELEDITEKEESHKETTQPLPRLPLLPPPPMPPPPQPPSKPSLEKITKSPIPSDFYCFYIVNTDKPECARFYNKSTGQLVCPQYFNPVYARDDTFYPSVCWAEALGVKEYFYGYSPALLTLFREQWAKEGFIVPHPNVEFTYQGGGTFGKSGPWLRSTLWHDAKTFSLWDYNIATTQGSKTFSSTRLIKASTFLQVMENNPTTLLAYVMFDIPYTETMLKNLTLVYTQLVNDYIKKKQKVPSPIQYKFTTVFINPPMGVERMTTQHIYFENEEVQAMYDEALRKSGSGKPEVFVIVPVTIGGFGGYYTFWNKTELIVAPLHPQAPYSATDKVAGINAIAAVQASFLTLSHEILHALGLDADHVPMGYGTTYLDWVGGLSIDVKTGKEISETKTACDFIGESADYYSVKLPADLQIAVGAEPANLIKEKSDSGDCLIVPFDNSRLKDYDRDGFYEIMYKNNLIGEELQRTLGWIDVDGDEIAELVDPTPYGKE